MRSKGMEEGESQEEGTLVGSEMGEEEGNQWEKLDLKGIWGLVQAELWVKGKRDSLNKTKQAM